MKAVVSILILVLVLAAFVLQGFGYDKLSLVALLGSWVGVTFNFATTDWCQNVSDK